jgi:aspartyl protease family protein
MGETQVKFRVCNGERSAELEGPVDTGATFTRIPRSMAYQLGLQAKYEVEVIPGDRRTVTRNLAPAEVEIEGIKRPFLLAIGEDVETTIIGYTTLEILGFKVNPLTGRLERTPAIEL